MQPTAFIDAVFQFVLLIFSLSVHECAHAWMASRLGDHTARLQGRVTLNPMYHVDPIGTLLFPALMIFGPFFGFPGGFIFGWAKPVPVITRNFRNIKRDDMLVSLAGPVSNLLLAIAATLALAALIVTQRHVPQAGMSSEMKALMTLCYSAIFVNLALFFFNLLPIPPLDGSHVLRQMLPYNALNAFDNLGMFSYLLMILIGGPIVRFLMGPALVVVNWLLRSAAGF